MSVEKVELAGGRAVLYRGDMFAAMPDMPDVDALITDPPYCSGIEAQSSPASPAFLQLSRSNFSFASNSS